MNAGEGDILDHVNGNTMDNRKKNLRFCSRKENVWNRCKRAGCASSYIGVYPLKRKNGYKKFTACIFIEGASFHLGVFVSEKEAAKTYDLAARKARGEFARLNFPKIKPK
jgi:hypothetical protein